MKYLFYSVETNCRQCEQTARDSTSTTNSSLSSDRTETDNTCHGPLLVEECQEAGGQCVTTQEGFYVMSGVWLAIGALWFVWIFRALRQLQTIEPGEWRVLNRPERRENGEKFNYFYFSVRSEEERTRDTK